eukprot:605920-Rhodomonas_salina.2
MVRVAGGPDTADGVSVCGALCGTEIARGRGNKGEERADWLSSYALATRCLVLTWAITLRLGYAMPGTDLGYAAAPYVFATRCPVLT